MAIGFFPAFFDQPQNIHFIEQNDDEVIELLLRKHPITNLPWIVLSIVAFFLPFLILGADRALSINLVEQLPGSVAVELLIMYDLLILAYAIESFLYWYFNIYIITNQHVVDITFDSILSRGVTESQYSDLKSVSTNLKGFVRESFNYGSVIMETAQNDENLVLLNVPNPDLVADRIRDIQQTKG